MKTISGCKKGHYLKRLSIFLIMVALVAGMGGCTGGGAVVEYDLTMAVAPSGSGTATDLTGLSPYAADAAVTIKAVAAAGYDFVNWTAPAGGFANATGAKTTFTMPAQDVTVTANFQAVAAPFAVTNVTANVTPSSYTGVCPKTFNFSAVIVVNGPGTVTYKWERSDHSIAPTQNITFAAAGSQTVTTTWALGAAGTHWYSIRIVTPNEMVSNQANFTLVCIT